MAAASIGNIYLDGSQLKIIKHAKIELFIAVSMILDMPLVFLVSNRVNMVLFFR